MSLMDIRRSIQGMRRGLWQQSTWQHNGMAASILEYMTRPLGARRAGKSRQIQSRQTQCGANCSPALKNEAHYLRPRDSTVGTTCRSRAKGLLMHSFKASIGKTPLDGGGIWYGPLLQRLKLSLLVYRTQRDKDATSLANFGRIQAYMSAVLALSLKARGLFSRRQSWQNDVFELTLAFSLQLS